MIDLRSDTVTSPTPGMRTAMAQAEVGDDVLGEDPTVLALEARVAELLGKPAALFVTSGTMGNQLGVRAHCGPGDEFLCDDQCHIFHYEQAAYAQLFGIAAQPFATAVGLPTVAQLASRVRGSDVHHPRTKLLCLENTHNRHGGVVLDSRGLADVCAWAAEAGLARHLDGARLWNAGAATGQTPEKLAKHFDTVSVCFSKGLGAPVGSALAGPADLISQARRTRKALGGGMRQAGILAAAALYALEHHLPRLAEDHQTADLLRTEIDRLPHLTVERPGAPDGPAARLTNLVFFEVDPTWGTATELCTQAEKRGLRMFAIGPQRVRAVTHREVSREAAAEACEVIMRIVQ